MEKEEMTKVMIIDDYGSFYNYLNLTKEQMRLLEYLNNKQYFRDAVTIQTVTEFETV